MKILLMALALVVTANANANETLTLEALKACIPTKAEFSDTVGEGDIPDDAMDAAEYGYEGAIDMIHECLKTNKPEPKK